MNFSTPNLSLSPSRCTAAPKPGKAGGASSPEESQGGFEEVFAGLAQRSEPRGPSRATLVGGVNIADSDEESASSPERLAQEGAESELDLKKKKSGEPVSGVMVQLLVPELPEVSLAGGEIPSGTETGCVPGDPIEEGATTDAPSIGEDSSSSVVTAEVSQTVLEPSAEVLATATENANASVERVSSPEIAPEPIALATTGTEAKLENVPDPAGRLAGTRGKRTGNAKPAPAADFAESEASHPEIERGWKTTPHKNFLSSVDKLVANRQPTLGTNVANGGSEMSSAPAAQILENVFSENTLSARVDAMAADFSAQNPPATGAALFTGAQHAIEAVLEAGERFTTEAQRAVKMEFSVSGENLSVRVEMHAGEVRTTFHTASAELRSALAHEWQALTAGDSGRSQRFADPVFSTGSDATAAQGNGGESQGNQRGQEMNQPRERFEFSPRPGAASPAHSAALPASSPTSVPLTALRLHTFA